MPKPLLALVLALAALTAPAPAQTVVGTNPVTGIQPGGPPTRNVLFRLSEWPVLWAEGSLGPVELDRANGGAAAGDGGFLTVTGRPFRTGFGARATSAIAFNLGGRASSFFSWYGIDDSAGPGASAVFRVVADGATLFDSGVHTAADGFARTKLLDVRGVRELILIATDAGDGFENDLVDWCDPLVFAAEAPSASDAPVRHVRGRFTGLTPWPVEAMHASLLPDGRVVTHASRSAADAGDPSPSAPRDLTRVDVYDPMTGLHTAFDHPTEEIIGAAHGRRPDGTLLTLGGYGGQLPGGAPAGQAQASAFDAGTGWLPGAPLVIPRHGPGATTLGSGLTLVVAGSNDASPGHAPELVGEATGGALPGVSSAPWLTVGDPLIDRQFPFLHTMPDGRAVVTGWDERVSVIDPTGTGRVTFSATRENVQRAFGTSTLVRGDLVLMTGGVDHRGSPGAAQRSVLRLDLGGATPTGSVGAEMLLRRADHDATLLADGTLLASGGARVHAASATNDTSARLAEIYDPATDSWSLAARSERPRNFRSTALLLPDGRVLLGGGDPAGPTAEFYEPPYLFDPRGTGALAARPAWTAVPGRVAYGETFSAQFSGTLPIERVTLLRLGSATRGVNGEQRFLELPFTRSGQTLSVDAPGKGNDAPPGAYMLFGFDESGVPTVARILRIGPPRPTAWELVVGAASTAPVERHETAMAEVGGKLYLIGGRGLKPTQEYDPATGEWRSLGPPPFEIHHFQPVVRDGLVHVVGAFTGGYPNESNVANIWIFDPADGSWTIGPALPPGRARGGAGAVVHDGRFYLVCGNNQGHNGGARRWFDVFDPATNSWTQLPDAPRARDHFLAAVVGNRLVVAGGRTTTQPNPFVGEVGEVDVYDFTTGTWSTIQDDLPTLRAGTMAAPIGRYVAVIGGESSSQVQSHREVEVLDALTESWLSLPLLAQGRHSGGIAALDGNVYVVSGSGNRGGSPELPTTELLAASDVLGAIPTASRPNRVANPGFDRGLEGWATTGSVTLVASPVGVAAPAARVRGGRLARSAALAVTPGAPYRARVLHGASQGAGSATLRMEWRDGGGLALGAASLTLPPATAPTLATLDANAPAGAAEVLISVETLGTREVHVDDLTLMVR